MSNKRVIVGLTGPSVFSSLLRQMVIDVFKAIPLDINQNDGDIEPIFNVCDFIILGGGCDIYPPNLPSEYIENENREIERHSGYSKFDNARDLREIEIISLAEKYKKNIFGICRGHQMLLAQKGLNLITDISNSQILHSGKDVELDGMPAHYLRCIGKAKEEFFDKGMVNSFHHQAIEFTNCVEALKFNVEVLGTSILNYPTKQNSNPEYIIEMARGKGFFSVQFHPESDYETNPISQKILNYVKKNLFI